MNTQNLTSFILLLVLLAVVGISHRQCSDNKELLSDIEKLKGYESEAKFYKGENGELIAYNNALEVSFESLKMERNDLAERLENMKIKDPEILVVTNTSVEIDSIEIPFETKIQCDDFTTFFQYRDSIWFVIQGRVSQDGIFVDNVSMENEILWVLGTKKNGFFKRNEYVVSMTNSNPYVTTKTIEPIIIQQKPAFYDRLWFKGLIFVGGVATGIAISR